MANDNENESAVTPIEDNSYGMAELIRSLIHDVIEADAQAADDFVEIVEEQAIDTIKNADGTERKVLKTVDYELEGEDGSVKVVTIPYISLLALPSLRISEATFELEAQMEVSKHTETETQTEGTIRKKSSGLRKAEIEADSAIKTFLSSKERATRALAAEKLTKFRFSTASTESSTEESHDFTNVKVTIKLAPTMLPNGVRGLLQYAGTNIAEREIAGSLE